MSEQQAPSARTVSANKAIPMNPAFGNPSLPVGLTWHSRPRYKRARGAEERIVPFSNEDAAGIRVETRNDWVVVGSILGVGWRLGKGDRAQAAH